MPPNCRAQMRFSSAFPIFCQTFRGAQLNLSRGTLVAIPLRIRVRGRTPLDPRSHVFLSQTETTAFFAVSDKNGDGQLSKKEFYEAIMEDKFENVRCRHDAERIGVEPEHAHETHACTIRAGAAASVCPCYIMFSIPPVSSSRSCWQAQKERRNGKVGEMHVAFASGCPRKLGL